MVPNTTLTRHKEQTGTEVWRLTISRFMAIISLLTGIFGIVSTSLGAAYWIIAPRLDRQIDTRIELRLSEETASAEKEYARIRGEAAALFAQERELRREQLSRIESDLLYIKNRIDQLYANGR